MECVKALIHRGRRKKKSEKVIGTVRELEILRA